MPPLPDPPSAPFHWPRTGTLAPVPGTRASVPERRWPRRAAFGLASVLAVLLLAAWSIPPLLDWGRFRAGFAAIAAAQLGRPVLLGGQVTLRLLPEAVLTATDLSLPDQGDGVSAQLGAMRLQVAVLPLLAGRIVPRDLVLGTPVLRLPWPLPQGLTSPARPLVPRAFAAHMENGTLLIGGLQVTGINAGIHGGPEPGVMASVMAGVPPDPSSVSAFGAEGFAAFGGRIWRFTSALGSPDADGVSALDLSVMGQGVLGKTGGSIQGTFADGVVQGRLRAGGTDLSLTNPASINPALMPGDGQPWRIEALFVADTARIEASAVELSLGAASADASLVLRLAAPIRLDGRVHAAALDLDRLAGVLGTRPAARGGVPAPKLRLALSADRARLFGATLTGLRGVVVSDGLSASLDGGEATLPGQALFHMDGTITDGPGGLRVSGPASLDAPDLHTTLAWLHGTAPDLFDAVPQAVLKRARVAGQTTLAPATISVSGLSGEVDGTPVTGAFGVTLGAHPHVAVSVGLGALSLDDWLGRPAPELSMASVAHRFGRLASDLHIRAASASWYGLTLSGLALDARTGPEGLAVDGAHAMLAGASLSAKGTLAPDGALAGGSLTLSTQDASPLLDLLPARWRLAPGLWAGNASLKAAVAGRPDSLGVQLRADAGDLVLEADTRADTLGRSMAGTVTLRHPGTPRLLASLGLPGAEGWLHTGSLALRAQVSLQPGQLSVPDFDLAAADLRLSGKLRLDVSPVFLHGTIAAETLALPGSTQAKPLLDLIPSWAAQLDVAAQRVLLGGRPALADLTANLGLGSGNGLLAVTRARAFGGQWTGQLAFAGDRAVPLLAAQAALTGAHIGGPVFGLPIDLLSGDADASLDLQASGADMEAWRRSLSGQMAVWLRDGQLGGFDLGQAGRLLGRPARTARAALQAALSNGSTPGLSGEARLTAAQGRITLAKSTLTSADGAVLIQGWAEGGALDLRFGLSPAGAAQGRLAVRMSGPFGAVSAVPDQGTSGSSTRRAKHG